MKNEKDILESFVKANKEAFDNMKPPMMDFGNIAKKEDTPKGKMISIKWFYAAAAIFAIALSAISFSLFFNSNESTQVAETQFTETESPLQLDFSLSELSPEMAELESYYLQQVATKQAELEKLGLDEDLAKEIEFLDNEFIALKNELGESVDNHLIVNEMIKNYKLKLDLLESVLSDMQDNYDDKNLTQHNDDEKYTIYY